MASLNVGNAPAGSRRAAAAAAVAPLLISHWRFSQLNEEHRITMEGWDKENSLN